MDSLIVTTSVFASPNNLGGIHLEGKPINVCDLPEQFCYAALDKALAKNWKPNPIRAVWLKHEVVNPDFFAEDCDSGNIYACKLFPDEGEEWLFPIEVTRVTTSSQSSDRSWEGSFQHFVGREPETGRMNWVVVKP